MDLVRERSHFCQSGSSRWLLLASLLDILIVSILSTQGKFMAATPLWLASGLMALVLVYLIAVDFIKIRVFYHFGF
ncbi:MAG: hypothetical protein ACXW11_00905 [Methylotenera sp.]